MPDDQAQGPHANMLPAETEGPQTGTEVMTRSAIKPPLIAGRNGIAAIIPQDIEQAFRLSSAIAAADMAPKSYARDVNKIMVGILHGLEVGFPPMAALQSIAVINGMPSIWGDGALALIEASGLLEDKIETIEVDAQGGMVAICKMKRRGRSWTEQTFSWQDAQIAKLVAKDTYKLYGRRMLQRRARAWCMTDGFSDVLRGLHIREAHDLGSLVEAAGGAYVPEQTEEPTPPRPTREGATKDAKETARKVALAQEKQYRDTMATEAAGTKTQKPAPEETQHNPETGEVDDEPEADESAQDQIDPASRKTMDEMAEEHAAEAEPEQDSARASECATIDSLIRRKVGSLTTTRMIDAVKVDYADELQTLKQYDRPRWDALKKFVDNRLAELKKK